MNKLNHSNVMELGRMDNTAGNREAHVGLGQ